MSRLLEAFTALGAEAAAEPWEARAITSLVARVRPDVVFGLLGTTAALAREAERGGLPAADYDAVDRALTLMALPGVAASAPAARFVYLSSAGADGMIVNAYLALAASREMSRRPLDQRLRGLLHSSVT